MPIKRNSDTGALFATYWVRCRRCKPCLKAKAGYWTAKVVERTRETADAGYRTWFGTLTLDAEAQRSLRDSAMLKWMTAGHLSGVPDWWDDPLCDERFRLCREVLVRECQLYMKRLRKKGHRFKYFLVFERHRSGLPHVHWLLHEETVIRKQDLQAQWPHGFTQVKLVGGYSRKWRRKLSPEFAAWYVAKYLSKAYQSRQLVSIRYAKTDRPKVEVKEGGKADGRNV